MLETVYALRHDLMQIKTLHACKINKNKIKSFAKWKA